MQIIFISVDNNYELYNKCVKENPFVKNNSNITTVSFDNTVENKFISVRYNEFLNSFDYAKSQEYGGAWFVFCHNDWEILEDIEPKLKNLDKNAIYGPIGTVLYKRNAKDYIIEWCGQCFEKKRDGSNLRLLTNTHTDTGTCVDIVDAQCMIVHSSLVEKYNLRFDEQFEYDMYVEDFMVNAKLKYNIQGKIINLKCCHWSQLDNINERESYSIQHKKFIDKYKKEKNIALIGYSQNKNITSIGGKDKNLSSKYFNPQRYDVKIDINNLNASHSIIFHNIKNDSAVLDVGCNVGVLGEALKKYKNCNATGIEYDAAAIETAKGLNVFDELIQADLNCFEPEDFPHLKGKFDYIVLGDVLEHLVWPDKVLNKLSEFLKRGEKGDGKFIISFPNIAHASIKSQILCDDWEYTDVGLLDRTHLRFFTRKTIIEFLAGLHLKIEKMDYTIWDVKGMQTLNYWNILPFFTKLFIKNNPHSFVLQYVVVVSKDMDKCYTHLCDTNKEKMEIPKTKYTKELKKAKRRAKLLPLHRLYWYLKYRLYQKLDYPSQRIEKCKRKAFK